MPTDDPSDADDAADETIDVTIPDVTPAEFLALVTALRDKRLASEIQAGLGLPPGPGEEAARLLNRVLEANPDAAESLGDVSGDISPRDHFGDGFTRFPAESEAVKHGRRGDLLGDDEDDDFDPDGATDIDVE